MKKNKGKKSYIVQQDNRIANEKDSFKRYERNVLYQAVRALQEKYPIKKLDDGYDMIQGSRFIQGGAAINTPKIRHFAVKLIHIPVISAIAGFKYTDTTNGYRGYSKKYLEHPDVQPFRDIFDTYELLAYLSVKAPRLGLKTCEVPVTRTYPSDGKVPTKISSFRGNFLLIEILWHLAMGKYNVKKI